VSAGRHVHSIEHRRKEFGAVLLSTLLDVRQAGG
jgi:hypothetical protein